jgi:hypothetical protein
MGVGRRCEVVLKQAGVPLCHLNGRCAAADAGQDFHELDCDPTSVGLLVRQSSPPLDRFPRIAGSHGQTLQSIGVRVREPAPLGFDPPFEFRSAGDMYVIEEWSRVTRHRLRRVVCRNRGIKLGDITQTAGAIDPHRSGTLREDHVIPEFLSQAV